MIEKLRNWAEDMIEGARSDIGPAMLVAFVIGMALPCAFFALGFYVGAS